MKSDGRLISSTEFYTNFSNIIAFSIIEKLMRKACGNLLCFNDNKF